MRTRTGHAARLVLGITVALALMAWIAPAPRASAGEEARASITIYKAFCPVGYEGDDYFKDCYKNEGVGITFELTPVAGGEAESKITDANGFTFFDNLPAGTYALSETIPGDFNEFVVRCTRPSDGANIPFTRNDTDGIDLTLAVTDDIRCDWYNIGVDQGAPTPTVVPESGSLTIYKSTCPVGYEDEDYFADCYENATANVTFTLSVEGGGTVGTSKTDANGFAFFENLDGAYVVEEDVPGEFAAAAAYCTEDGDPVEFGFDGDNSRFRIDVDATQDIRCDYYNIPFNLRGETPTVAPTVAPPAPTTAPSATTVPVVTLPNTGANPASTGDDRGALWLAGMLVCAAGVLGTVALRRRPAR